jgi:hypothetical protein
VGPGTATGALENFLFSTRRGYCEQFAGRTPPWRAPWAIPLASRSGSPRGSGTPTTPTCTGCAASTPTPGPRSTSASTGGCRSSRRPGRGPPGGRGLPRRPGEPGDRQRSRDARGPGRPEPGPGHQRRAEPGDRRHAQPGRRQPRRW